MKNGSESVVHGSAASTTTERVEYPKQSTLSPFASWQRFVATLAAAAHDALCAVFAAMQAPARRPARIPVSNRPTQYKD